MRSVPLKIQYVIGICGLILFVSATLLLYIHGDFNKRLETELHKRSASIARNLAEASVKPIITENHVALQLLVNNLKRNEDDIRYIYIVTKQQQVVAHTFDRSFPHDLLKLDRPVLSTGKPLIQTLQVERERLEDVSVSIQQGDFGRVHIGISEEMVKAEQRDMVLNNAPFIGLILLLGSIGAWWFASRITSPIITLSNSAKKVAEGEFDVLVEVTSHDEIGELTSSFNSMTADLKKRTDQQRQTEYDLRMQASLLEEEVAQRQKAQEELSAKQDQLQTLNCSLEERINCALAELRTKDRVMLTQGRQAAMGEMINNIAHQWRQPLNNLGLIVQNIKADYDSGSMTPEMMTGDVGKVMNTIMFMSQTINDFSSFFRPDNERTVFCISRSLTKVVAMIEASLSLHGIRLIIVQEEEDVAVEGYFNEYNQVLLNLLNNAKDVLLEREVEKPVITVIISMIDGLAVVRVQDNAGGIPDTIIGQIFDPYFTTKDYGKGSGIGLYMSKTIIGEHFSGSLSASNVAGGAQFSVATPLAQIGQ